MNRKELAPETVEDVPSVRTFVPTFKLPDVRFRMSFTVVAAANVASPDDWLIVRLL